MSVTRRLAGRILVVLTLALGAEVVANAREAGQVYTFGESSFSTFMWIKNGDLFTNTKLVEIEMTNAGAFALEVYDSSDHLVSKGERANAHGGWSTFDFRAGMTPPVPSGTYKLKLVNRTSGTRQVKQGQVSPSM